MADAHVAVIGGSGLYQMDGLESVEQVEVPTPFGSTSGPITLGTLAGLKIAFLPRHGIGHRIMPTEVPSQANIYALKTLGVERIISVSAVGSLQENIHPLDIVVPDQLIDRTRGPRPGTFFGNGIVAHVGFADPFCPELSELMGETAAAAGATVHSGGTYVVMEGPMFSTKAESALHRSWGASIIGMTALPEAKLAREAELCYSTLACVTDYDVWHETEEAVSVALVIQNLLQNVKLAKQVLIELAPKLSEPRSCNCGSALENAIITDSAAVPAQIKRDLAPIIGKYVS
ncbi:MAG: 5'-methylthioadenosine phosphorylase [Chloroflexi bacterium]|jgi:5'-methylthioadenosine phosphorylase|nr:MAG: 5'-methylthioadenosine phosphorylase [Chloroflexota bacterium]